MEIWRNQKAKGKMAVLSPSLLISTLNVDGLIHQSKTTEWLHGLKTGLNYMLPPGVVSALMTNIG